MALEGIAVNDIEGLDEDSREVLRLCSEIEACVKKIKDEDDRLGDWITEDRTAFQTELLQPMTKKLNDMCEIARSYGDVGVQQAAIFTGVEEGIRAVANKVRDEIA